MDPSVGEFLQKWNVMDRRSYKQLLNQCSDQINRRMMLDWYDASLGDFWNEYLLCHHDPQRADGSLQGGARAGALYDGATDFLTPEDAAHLDAAFGRLSKQPARLAGGDDCAATLANPSQASLVSVLYCSIMHRLKTHFQSSMDSIMQSMADVAKITPETSESWKSKAKKAAKSLMTFAAAAAVAYYTLGVSLVASAATAAAATLTTQYGGKIITLITRSPAFTALVFRVLRSFLRSYCSMKMDGAVPSRDLTDMVLKPSVHFDMIKEFMRIGMVGVLSAVQASSSSMAKIPVQMLADTFATGMSMSLRFAVASSMNMQLPAPVANFLRKSYLIETTMEGGVFGYELVNVALGNCDALLLE